MKNEIRRLLCLTLAAIMTIALAACNGGGGGGSDETTIGTTSETTESIGTTSETTDEITSAETDEGTVDTTDTTETDATQTTEETTEPESTDPNDTEIFENGAPVEGAGVVLGDSFASLDHEIDAGSAIEIGAAELEEMLSLGTLEAGKTYSVSDAIALSSDKNYNGGGAKIIAKGGFIIDSVSNVSICDLVIEGKMSIVASSGISLTRVSLTSSETALSVSDGSVTVEDCRFISNTLAIDIDGDGSIISKSYISAPVAIEINGDGNLVLSSKVIAIDCGITLCGDSNTVRGSDIESASDGIGISIQNGAVNTLVALNGVMNSQSSIVANATFNTVVLLNSAIRVIGADNTNIYVVSNSLGGRIDLRDNNYLICDANAVPEDSKNHDIISLRNQNMNGDNVTDVNARAEVGVNEDILPHTNKELFVSMERKTEVYDHETKTSHKSIAHYIRAEANGNDVVIIPPGAYAAEHVAFDNRHANTTIYGYGAYLEVLEYGQVLSFGSTSDISVYGLTIGYAKQPSGQVHILKRLGSSKLLVAPAAGYDQASFVAGNNDWFTKEKDGSTALYPIASLSNSLTWNDDGTGVLTLTGSDTGEYYNVKVGDILVSRLSETQTNSIGISVSNRLGFKDLVIYGYSRGLAIVVSSDCSGITLNRVHNTTRPAFVISEEEYEKYSAWEKEYNVDLEISIDADGNHRGSIPRIGSVDATHLSGAREGLHMVSSILEQMCDDGSNHHGSSSRLHDIIDNEDGTTTIYYKGMTTSVYHSSGAGTLSGWSTFTKGDRVFIYVAASGKIVCDTPCLRDTKSYKDIEFNVEGVQYKTTVYSVTVATDAVDFSAIEGIDLSDNHYSMNEKVIVDNASRVSGGMKLDNVLIQNHRSRGILVKTRDAEIVNCTFRNLGHTAILMSVESEWGESSVSQNILVDKCEFDHVGFIDRNYTYSVISPIHIYGFGSDIEAVDKMACNNITVNGCVFKNNLHKYAIVVWSAQDVKITNNKFGVIYQENGREALGVSVLIRSSKDIFLEGNEYPYLAKTLSSTVQGSNYKNVSGADTLDENGESLIPDNIGGN